MTKVLEKKPDSYDMLFYSRNMQLGNAYTEWREGIRGSFKERLVKAKHWYPLVESMVGAPSQRMQVWSKFRDEVPKQRFHWWASMVGHVGRKNSNAA